MDDSVGLAASGASVGISSSKSSESGPGAAAREDDGEASLAGASIESEGGFATAGPLEVAGALAGAETGE